MELNNREISFLIWMAIFAIWGAFQSRMRKASIGVLAAFFQKYILLALAVATIWISACVWVLSKIDLWRFDNLKTTLVWAVTFAFVTMLDVSRISEDNTFFGKTVRDTLSATAVITFISELYTFNIWAELILLPFLTTVALMQVVAAHKPEHKSVEKLSAVILTIAGLSYFAYGIYKAETNFKDFATLENFREFAIPILLSLLFLPLMYFFSTYVTYENNMVRLNWVIEDKKLRRYAKRQAVLNFGFNVELVRRWSRDLNTLRPQTRQDIKKAISNVKSRRVRELNPPPVNPLEGWSPYAAKDYLAVFDLPTNDYHPSYEDEWFASSNMQVIEDTGLMPDNLAYYVEGTERSAKRLKLRLHVNNPASASNSRDRYFEACAGLIENAVGDVPVSILENIANGKAFDEVLIGRRVRLVRDEYTGGIKDGYSLTLIIDHSPDYRAPFEE